MIINKLSNKENQIINITLEIKPKIFNKDRFYLSEPWNTKDFINKINSDTSFVQDNQDFSEIGKLKWLHYQLNRMTQGKLLRLKKCIFFDLRQNSKTLKNKYEIIDFHYSKKIIGLTHPYLRNKLFKFLIIHHLLKYKLNFK